VEGVLQIGAGCSVRGVSQLYRYRYCCDMAGARSYRRIVREIGLDNYGFVTTRAAAEAGVPPVELPKLSTRGGLENVAYGLYRVTDVPATPVDQLAEALFRVGEGEFLYGESVLALFSLADVNPRKVYVAIARRARPKLPSFIELVRVWGGERTTQYEGLAAQPIAEAILVCRARVETRRLLEAAKEARAEGLLTLAEWRRVMRALRA